MLQRRALRQLATGKDVLQRRALRQLATGERCASEACPSTAGDMRREDVLQRRALRQLAKGEGLVWTWTHARIFSMEIECPVYGVTVIPAMSYGLETVGLTKRHDVETKVA